MTVTERQASNGEYEVHNIGVNWPHHIFVNQDFKVVGADKPPLHCNMSPDGSPARNLPAVDHLPGGARTCSYENGLSSSLKDCSPDW